MEKKYLALALAIIWIFTLCACGIGSSTTDSETEATEVSDAGADETEGDALGEDNAEDTSTMAESETDGAESETVEASEDDIADTTSTIEYPIDGDYSFTMIARKNNVTAEAYGDGGYEQTVAYAAISEATGITIEFEMIAEQTFTEKLNLMMASSDLPDIFNSSIAQYDNNVIGAIEDNVIIDLEPYLEEYAPDYVAFLEEYPDVSDTAYNGDGSIGVFMSSTAAYRSKGMHIRSDWLDTLDMDTPTTLDELTEILIAFKNELGVSNPLLVNSQLETGLSRYFQADFTGFQTVEYQLKDSESGEVVAVCASEGYISYLEYLHELYELGVVSSDFLSTSREAGNFESSYLTGVSGVWEDASTVYEEANLEKGEDGYDPEPFVLTGEEESHVSDVSTVDVLAGRNYISTACESPEIAVEFFNYCYTEEGQLLYNYGVEGISFEYNENGEIVFTEVMTNNENGWAINLCKAFYTGQWLCGEGTWRMVELQNCDKALEAITLWTDAAGDRSMALPDGVSLNADEQIEFSALSGDILTSITENSSKVVVGDITVDDYRSLLEDLGNIGLDRMTELYQAAYDRYMESHISET